MQLQLKFIYFFQFFFIFLLIHCAQSGKRLNNLDQRISRLNQQVDSLRSYSQDQIERRQELVHLIQSELVLRELDEQVDSQTTTVPSNRQEDSSPEQTDSSEILSVPMSRLSSETSLMDTNNVLSEANALFENREYSKSAYRYYEVYLSDNTSVSIKEESLYQAGHSFFLANDWNQTIDTHLRFFHEYPQSRNIPSALLQAGKSYRALGHHEQARAAFQHLLDHYPNSQEAQEAKDNLLNQNVN